MRTYSNSDCLFLVSCPIKIAPSDMSTYKLEFLPGGVFPSIYLLFYIEGHELFEIEGK